MQLLLVDDDEGNLALLADTLADELAGTPLRWDPCPTFDEALSRIRERRYDIVVSDIYLDRENRSKDPAGRVQAREILEEIRQHRFCPVLFFTDGSFPDDLHEGPFVKVADKSVGNGIIEQKLEEIILTGVPVIASRLHEELDRAGRSYLWDFLDSRWSELKAAGLAQGEVLERLIRRRASVMIGRLDPASSTEVERIEGAEFYLFPTIAGDLRLGTVLRHRQSHEFRVVLTPHCHLVVRPGSQKAGADHILTVRTVPWAHAFRGNQLPTNASKKLGELKKRLQSPTTFGTPAGRYWFLPGLLDIPELYIDFLQVESLPWAGLRETWEAVAALDSPFAEALQSCFGRFYATVGLPEIRGERLTHMLEHLPVDAEVPPQQENDTETA